MFFNIDNDSSQPAMAQKKSVFQEQVDCLSQ